MKTIILIVILMIATLASLTSQAAIVGCPDPKTSSLRWGTVPEPWLVNPFSVNRPQGEANLQFVSANIMVAGIGRGVICTYRNSVGLYSIWWPVRVKIPSFVDRNWIGIYGGFICTEFLSNCKFSVAVG